MRRARKANQVVAAGPKIAGNLRFSWGSLEEVSGEGGDTATV